MKTWVASVAIGIAAVMLWSMSALAQAKPADCPRPGTPEKLEGRVVKIDMDQGKLSVRGSDGMLHEFQASKETLQDMKEGERVAAKLRADPNCK